MKNKLILNLLAFLAFNLSAQLTGNKYIPGDYGSIGEAVDSLNLHGVGFGGVTFNIQAGYLETNAISPITVTGTVNNPIVFQKFGIGDNPKINYPAQITNAAFQLMGSDYVTIDGITFENLFMGIAFIQQGPNNGCLYNEIKNCQFINTTFLLWSSRNTIATDIAGTHSHNKIYNNEYIIQNAVLSAGSAAIYFFSVDNNQSISDQGNEIGVEGGNVFSYQNSSGLTYVANINHQKSLSFENNLIECNNHNGAFYGVSSFGITFPPFLDYVVSDNVSIQNNVFNLNNITNSGSVTPISIACAQSLYDSVLVTGNTITGTNINSTSFMGIRITDVSSENVIVAENNIGNLTTAIGNGNFAAVDFIFGSGSNYLVRNNTINNIQDSGNALFSGIKIGPGDGSYDIFKNEILNIGKSNLSSGDLRGVVLHSGTTKLINNDIHNLNNQGAGSLFGVYGTDTMTLEIINYNRIYDLSANNSASGLQLKSEGIERHISENEIYNIHGQNQAFGAKFSGANTTFNRNKIHNISSEGSTGKSWGISAVQLDTFQFSNNLIGEISADFSNDLNGAVGVHLDSLENAFIFYNSIVLNGENSNQELGSSALYLGDKAREFDLRNNIFINKTQANGNGFSVALRLADEDLNLLSSNNDNNLYFVDTTQNSAAFFYDGINTDFTFQDFKSRMDFREQNSVMEDVLFESLNGNSNDFLRPDNTIPTFIESNAQEISGFEDDFHFLQIRTGYPLLGQANGGGEQPDIGAVEGDYVPKTANISTNELKENQISIYPNPAVDQVFIQTNGLENYKLTVTDVNGKVLLEENVTNEVKEVDVSGLAKGMYVFSLDFERNYTTTKVVID